MLTQIRKHTTVSSEDVSWESVLIYLQDSSGSKAVKTKPGTGINIHNLVLRSWKAFKAVDAPPSLTKYCSFYFQVAICKFIGNVYQRYDM